MKRLFKRATVFGDLHFGKKNNQRQFNIDCENFVKWFIDESLEWGADTCIFLGDWHDNRRFINVSTMNYSLSNLERLDKSFEKVYFILGNHDLYYREKREINSVEYARNLENFVIVNDFIVEGGCVFVPWLVGDEYKKLSEIECKYMFGHFELPSFLMNAMVEMPDKGEVQLGDLSKPDYVFSGHFHKRQRKENIWYIGNAFPHNYSDAWDSERGMMFLEWDGEPEFKSWPDQPLYINNIRLSELLDNDPGEILNGNIHARITADVDMSYEEAQHVRETFMDVYGVREVNIIPDQNIEGEFESSEESDFKTVDQIVIEGLQSIENTDSSIDYKLLISLYNSLDIDHN